MPLVWYGGDTGRLHAAARALACVHAVDWRAAGLSFLLPPGARSGPLPSPLACELPQWRERAAHLGCEGSPLLVALAGYLAANEPADARHALLHGDSNAGNYLFRGKTVVAVLDWELCAIGDPRSDLGFYAALMTLFGGMPGDAGRSVLSAAYEEVTGSTLHSLAYYEAFGLYRMLIVMGGWAGRMGAFGGFYGGEIIERRLSALLGPRWAA
jgi:aminoglycoside phosphotransferase (APT) family kinase protein